jgi:formate hydrogenlyase transcriptional activator
MVTDKEFRADLFYRVSVFPIALPPLRDHRDDIPALARHFVAKYAERMNKVITEIPSETMEAMLGYDWPGNVRQLQNFIEHGVIVSPGATFAPPLSQLRPQRISVPKNSKTLDDATRDHVLQTLEETKWVVGGRHGAAARLGIARTTLVSKMRRLGIESATDEARARSGSRHAAFASA